MSQRVKIPQGGRGKGLRPKSRRKGGHPPLRLVGPTDPDSLRPERYDFDLSGIRLVLLNQQIGSGDVTQGGTGGPNIRGERCSVGKGVTESDLKW